MQLISQVKNSGYAFQMEIIVRAQYLNYKLAEIPITFVDRLMGKSKLGMNEILLFLKTVFSLYGEL